MALDSLPVLSILDRVTDDDGAIVPGAVLYFYGSGTTDPLTVYADAALAVSLGTSVTCDSGGYPTSDGTTKVTIFVGVTDWKVVVKDSAGATLFTRDGMPGADASASAITTALPETPVVTRTTTYAILVADQGKLINADPTGGSFALTLPSASTAGDGYRIGIRHSGASTTNSVSVRTTGGQTIGTPGQSTATSISLTGLGQTYWFASDGASGWSIDAEVPALMGGATPYIMVKARLTAPPASPIGGYRYIINGTPTGLFATLSFAENDIAENDGNGSYIKYTPRNGYLAYVEDEELLTQWRTDTWTDLSNITAPTASALGVYELSYGGGGTNTIAATTWTTLAHATAHKNSITGASVAGGVITLPTGNYIVFASMSALLPQSTTASVRARLYSTASSTTKIGSVNNRNVTVASNNIAVNLPLFGFLSVTDATETFAHQWWSTDNNVTLALTDSGSSGVTDRFATITIVKIDATQGPQGIQGVQGDGGLDAAYAYTWDTGTTAADPGNGKIRINHATPSSATRVYISDTSAAAADLTTIIGSWDTSTSATKGRLKWSVEGDQSKFMEFFVTAVTDSGDYFTLTVSHVGDDGAFSNGDAIAVLFTDNGDIGDPGITTPDITLATQLLWPSVAAADETFVYDASVPSMKRITILNPTRGLRISEFLTSNDPDVDQSAEVTEAITALWDGTYKGLDLEHKDIGLSTKLSFICGVNGFTTQQSNHRNKSKVLANGQFKWLGGSDPGEYMMTMGCPYSVQPVAAFNAPRFRNILFDCSGVRTGDIGGFKFYNFYAPLFENVEVRDFKNNVGIFLPATDTTGAYVSGNGALFRNCRWSCLPTASNYTGPAIRAYCGDVEVTGGISEWCGGFDFHIGSVSIINHHWSFQGGTPANLRIGATFRDPREIIITGCDCDNAGFMFTNDGYLAGSGITSGSPTQTAATAFSDIKVVHNKMNGNYVPATGTGMVTVTTVNASTTLSEFLVSGNTPQVLTHGENAADFLRVIVSGAGSWSSVYGTYNYVDGYGVAPGDKDLGAVANGLTLASQAITCIEDGRIQITSQVRAGNGTAALPSISAWDTPGTGMWFPGTGIIAWSRNAVEKMRFDVNGLHINSDVATDSGITRLGAGSLGIATVPIVTTTATQTLTNKAIALGSNTVSGTMAQFDTAATDGNFLWAAGVGSVVQAWDAQLDSLSSASANGVSLVTAANYAAMFKAMAAWTVIASGSLSGTRTTLASSIVATYSELMITITAASSGGTDDWKFSVSTDNAGSWALDVPLSASIGAAGSQTWVIRIDNYTSTSASLPKSITASRQYNATAAAGSAGILASTAAIDAISLALSANSFDAGTYVVMAR